MLLMLLVQSVFRIKFWKTTECHWRINFREMRTSRKTSSEALIVFLMRDYGDLDSLIASRDGENSCFQNIL